ncbi:MAG: hypothetical protein IJ561_01055 [Ruminococcus sp.]|nr:hypothetical protein [Ruminococcus sp.]
MKKLLTALAAAAMLASCSLSDDSSSLIDSGGDPDGVFVDSNTADSISLPEDFVISREKGSFEYNEYTEAEISPMTLDGLLEETEVIIIGTVASKPEEQLTYSDQATKTNISSGYTAVTLSVDKVLYGSYGVGSVTVKAPYYFIPRKDAKDLLHTYDIYSPYSRGEQWIFVLGYDGFIDEYSVKARFPLPESLGSEDRLGFVNGLLYPEYFDETLCREIYERFGLN